MLAHSNPLRQPLQVQGLFPRLELERLLEGSLIRQKLPEQGAVGNRLVEAGLHCGRGPHVLAAAKYVLPVTLVRLRVRCA